MTSRSNAAEDGRGDRRLALLLAMAMFVLVVDTSIMNVSISAVVHDPLPRQPDSPADALALLP
jgi:hypothetical protein